MSEPAATLAEKLADLRHPHRLIGKVKAKVQNMTKDGSRGGIVGYVDFRHVQEAFDEVFGPLGWKTEVVSTAAMGGGYVATCRLSLRDPSTGEWVAREDTGTGNGVLDTAYKGAVSDGFKRAAVQWGFGRALYALSSPWVALSNKKMKAADAARILRQWEEELRAMGTGLPEIQQTDDGGVEHEEGGWTVTPESQAASDDFRSRGSEDGAATDADIREGFDAVPADEDGQPTKSGQHEMPKEKATKLATQRYQALVAHADDLNLRQDERKKVLSDTGMSKLMDLVNVADENDTAFFQKCRDALSTFAKNEPAH